MSGQLEVICANCGTRRVVLETDRPLEHGLVLTDFERSLVAQATEAPCSSCDANLAGSVLVPVGEEPPP